MTKKPTIDCQIIFEDNHMIIINKIAGQIVQGDKSDTTPLSEIIKAYIKEKYDKPGNVYLGVVHRIDQPSSGLVIFAKTSKALTRLNNMMKNREVKKKYLIVISGTPKDDNQKLIHHLWRNNKTNKSTAFAKPNDETKMASLVYKKLFASNNYSVLEIDLQTGRHHQIRSQMNAIGHPIKNDRKYGAKRTDGDYDGIFLHAWKLNFIHPIKKTEMTIKAPIPWGEKELKRLGLSLKNIN